MPWRRSHQTSSKFWSKNDLRSNLSASHMNIFLLVACSQAPPSKSQVSFATYTILDNVKWTVSTVPSHRWWENEANSNLKLLTGGRYSYSGIGSNIHLRHAFSTEKFCYVHIASFNCHIQGSPLMETKTFTLMNTADISDTHHLISCRFHAGF